MRLTVEEHREAIKRYGHIKPARGWKDTSCSSRCPGTARTCSRIRGHSGPHVAHGLFQKVVAVWDPDGTPRSPGTVVRRASEERARMGGRPRRPFTILAALRDGVIRTISSMEEILFLVFFLAFLGFAIHWLLLIAG
jgi:hypothetical protein